MLLILCNFPVLKVLDFCMPLPTFQKKTQLSFLPNGNNLYFTAYFQLQCFDTCFSIMSLIFLADAFKGDTKFMFTVVGCKVGPIFIKGKEPQQCVCHIFKS